MKRQPQAPNVQTPVEMLVDAAFDLSMAHPALWRRFIEAYNSYTIKTALDMASAAPDKLEFAQGGLFFLKQQAEVFSDIHNEKRKQEADRQRRLANNGNRV
ncbi:hypothetical protein [Methylocystis heyeri]|uniref:Uncharacterized protein n=1 Tax=Methylocystis heyeri TaxID=391905 RepID=A0A6B8KEK2_9HYPH|nr:hypothetical protein [Methylocystis heyeri]QGM46117.1 hypothetical protein H2LOC_010660 [Methylocystis heyeri]